jgi:peptide/nickel transport system substrate-binding protein
VVEYRPDDIVVLRRNPYYWKVDSDGRQLPYLDEMQYRLSTWADRDVQAVAGTADFSNLEQAENYVEALKKSAEDTAPARLAFGPRTIGYSLDLNLSGNGWGEPDARGQKVRELNRNFDFRKALTLALDRQRLGDSLVKGPFTAIYPGGLYAGTSYYDAESTVYYPFDLAKAKEHLAAAGLEDTDGHVARDRPDAAAGDGEDARLPRGERTHPFDRAGAGRQPDGGLPGLFQIRGGALRPRDRGGENPQDRLSRPRA